MILEDQLDEMNSTPIVDNTKQQNKQQQTKNITMETNNVELQTDISTENEIVALQGEIDELKKQLEELQTTISENDGADVGVMKETINRQQGIYVRRKQ